MPFCAPKIAEYESEKHIRIVVPRLEQSLFQLPAFELNKAGRHILEGNPRLSRLWHCFFSRRLRAAVTGASTRIATLFPGHTVAAPQAHKPGRNTRYRGSLLFHQYLDLLSFDGGRPTHGDLSAIEPAVSDGLSPVPEPEHWPWTGVKQPVLSFLEPPEAGCDSAPNELIGHLQKQIATRLQAEPQPLKDLLQRIHLSWGGTQAPDYKAEIWQLCWEIASVARLGSNDNFLPFLFELEGFASYCTYAEAVNPFASGLYGQNWTEVGTVELSSCHPTELCERDRLLEELINLPSRGFAPIIVNEFDCVVDGNHRLTAAWIWNLLKYANASEWSVDDRDFQDLVVKFMRANSKTMSAVTRHQVLTHLATFLTNDVYRRRLTYNLAAPVKCSKAIDKLPAVLLPEYSSCPVLKEAYDQGRGRFRVNPRVFASLRSAPHTVLRPRAAYHFTDCAILPWFSVVKPNLRSV